MAKTRKKKFKKTIEVVEKLGNITLASYSCVLGSVKEVEDYANSVIMGCGGNPVKEVDSKPTLESLINKSQHKQLCSRLSILPSPALLERAETVDCKNVWRRMNYYSRLLSKCLAVRLLRQDGDPIRHLLIKGNRQSQLLHQAVWSNADYLESLLSLIQLGWRPISTRLKEANFLTESGFQVFMSIIVENTDSSFMQYLEEDFNISFTHHERLLEAEAKLLYRQQTPLSDGEVKAWNAEEPERDLVMEMIVIACLEDVIANKNNALRSRISDLRTKQGRFADAWSQVLRYQRQTGNNSFTWEDQTHLSM